MKSTNEYYLVKYVNADALDFIKPYFATYIHKDMIKSYIDILRTNDMIVCNRKEDMFGEITFKNIADIYFNPSISDDTYNTIIVLVENWNNEEEVND